MTNIRFATVLWRNSMTFKSKIRNASPSRKVHVKRYLFVAIVMLLPVKPWEILSLARITSRRFFGLSRIRMFCLTWFESSLVGLVWTESLRTPPLSSDTGSYFTIKSSRLMVEVTFLDLFQPRSFRGDFSFSWCGMTSYSASCWRKHLFAQCWMRFCVCLQLLRTLNTDFAHFVRILCTLDTASAHVVQNFLTYTDLVFRLLMLSEQ